MTIDLQALPRPEGWTLASIYGSCVLLRSPRGGMMTLDLAKRGFRVGLVTTGRLTNTRTYAGRGWLAALCADAITWLEAIEAPRKASTAPAKPKVRRQR